LTFEIPFVGERLLDFLVARLIRMQLIRGGWADADDAGYLDFAAVYSPPRHDSLGRNMAGLSGRRREQCSREYQGARPSHVDSKIVAFFSIPDLRLDRANFAAKL
jgi:hypothetical protein